MEEAWIAVDPANRQRAITGMRLDYAEGLLMEEAGIATSLPGCGSWSKDIPDDGTVIARSCGNPELFALVFQRHADAICRYTARRLGAQIAQDITAETFLLAFRHRAGYDETCADARPWLYGIAGNLIRRHHRAEARMLRALGRSGCDPVAESFTELADDRLAAAASASRVATALAALNPGQRDVVLLVAWAELSFDQVAEALGIPSGTVRSRMNRARDRLRSALSDLDPDQHSRTEKDCT